MAARGTCGLDCRISAVNVVVDGVLDAAEAEAAVQDCSTVLLVALAKAWVLVELGQDLVECRHRMVGGQVLELLLDRLAGQLLVLLELIHQAVLVSVMQIWVRRL